MLALAGCGDDDSGPIDSGPLDSGTEDATDAGDASDADAMVEVVCPEYLWEPDQGELNTFPDRALLVPDETTATGVRIEVTEAAFPGVAEFATYGRTLTESASGLDGFGTTAGAFFRFSGRFDDDVITSARGAAGFVVLGESPRLIEAQLVTAPRDRGTLMAWPMQPLPEQADVAVYLTDVIGAGGSVPEGCEVQSSAGMNALLAAPDEELGEALNALTELGVATDTLIAVQPYTTQTITEPSMTIAESIAAVRDDELTVGLVSCEPDVASTTHCVHSLESVDYRNAQGVVSAGTGSTWTLSVHTWLPPGDGPFPTLFFAHGLTASATNHPYTIVETGAPEGFAIVAVSAVEHPGHPTGRDGRMPLDTTLAFFGLDTDIRWLDARQLRGNFQQSVFDRLWVTRWLESAPDLNGDGVADVDPARLGYIGISLGGLMGPQLLALSDAYRVAVLGMPAGRMTQILSDDDSTFATILPSLVPREVPRNAYARIFPYVQTVVDAGDPGSWARHVQRERLVGAAPDLFVFSVIGDNTVPNAGTRTLVRALEIPQMQPVLVAVDGVEQDDTLPLSHNLAGLPGVTGAFQQYDLMPDMEGGTRVADHFTVWRSELANSTARTFIRTSFEGEAVLDDPYPVFGVPHAE